MYVFSYTNICVIQASENATGERPIPIIQTNQPSIKQSQSKGNDNNEKMEINP